MCKLQSKQDKIVVWLLLGLTNHGLYIMYKNIIWYIPIPFYVFKM